MYIYNAKIEKCIESNYKENKVKDFINNVRLKMTVRKVLKQVYREEKVRN